MSVANEGDLLDDRYRVGVLLGRGGMGAVHRAEDLRLGRVVALKLYPTGLVENAERRQAEARNLAALTDPGIVTLFDARLDGDPAYLVMEYIDGEDLAHRLRRRPLGPARTASLLVAVAGGLAMAHGRGYVHRDVKPANILIPHDPGESRARLADFGIARLMDETRLTTTGSVLGTAAYLSPEQMRGDAASPAGDVYSLGLVVAESISGAHPFPGAGIEAAMARLHRRPELASTIPGEWRELLEGMTEDDPAGRPTATEVSRIAAQLVAATPTEERPTETLPEQDRPTRARSGAATAVLPARMVPTRPATAATIGAEPERDAPPPDPAGRRAGRTRILSLAGGAIALLLLAAIVIGLAVSSRRPTAAASPSPSGTTASATPRITATPAVAVESTFSPQVRSALAALDSAIVGQGLGDLRSRLVAAIQAGDTASESAILDAFDAAAARSGSADTAMAIESATDQLRTALGIESPAPNPGKGPADPGKGNGNGNGKKGP